MCDFVKFGMNLCLNFVKFSVVFVICMIKLLWKFFFDYVKVIYYLELVKCIDFEYG